MTTTTASRASSMRRLRRWASSARQLYCRTNGCASFLEIEPTGKIATCPICGYTRSLS